MFAYFSDFLHKYCRTKAHVFSFQILRAALTWLDASWRHGRGPSAYTGSQRMRKTHDPQSAELSAPDDGVCYLFSPLNCLNSRA
jgi:hypothetical protein